MKYRSCKFNCMNVAVYKVLLHGIDTYQHMCTMHTSQLDVNNRIESCEKIDTKGEIDDE